jgi:hypothetical protein
MKEYFLQFFEGDISLTEGNYWDSVLKPAKTERELNLIKKLYQIVLPKDFEEFYNTCQTPEVVQTSLGIALATPTITGEETAIKYVENYAFTVEFGLIPFGVYQDEWVICMDISDGTTNANPGIKLFEMSLWHDGKKAISPKQWFSSFNHLILCLTDDMKTGTTDNFDAIDPGNNFATAYPYWKNPAQ